MGFATRKRSLFLVPLVISLTFILAGIAIGMGGHTSTAIASPPMTLPRQLPDNAACLSCHLQEGLEMEFPNGEIISAQVNPSVFGQSAHATISCQVCHTNISSYPHPENVAQTSREYTFQYQTSCNQCHPSQASETMDSAHTRLLLAGDTNAPICADCHNPHSQPSMLKDEVGTLSPQEHAYSSQICADCHSSIYEQYASSVHGTGVIIDKNPDVPSCIDCHGVHQIEGPGDGAAFRLTSPQICADCHTDEEIMGKYDLSTQVLQTYIADFHGTTVTLFEKIDPDQQTNMPVCYDCHGIHDIRRSDDPEKGLHVKENLLVTCQRCHPDATANFPDSWLSHYIPSAEKFPLVYYVNLFYKILIPTVLGGMGIFVASDVFRKVVIDRRKKTQGVEDINPEAPDTASESSDPISETRETVDETQEPELIPEVEKEETPESPVEPQEPDIPPSEDIDKKVEE